MTDTKAKVILGEHLKDVQDAYYRAAAALIALDDTINRHPEMYEAIKEQLVLPKGFSKMKAWDKLTAQAKALDKVLVSGYVQEIRRGDKVLQVSYQTEDELIHNFMATLEHDDERAVIENHEVSLCIENWYQFTKFQPVELGCHTDVLEYLEDSLDSRMALVVEKEGMFYVFAE